MFGTFTSIIRVINIKRIRIGVYLVTEYLVIYFISVL